MTNARAIATGSAPTAKLWESRICGAWKLTKLTRLSSERINIVSFPARSTCLRQAAASPMKRREEPDER